MIYSNSIALDAMSMRVNERETLVEEKLVNNIDPKQIEQNVEYLSLSDHVCLIYLIRALINEIKQRQRIEDYWTFRQGRRR